MSSEVITKLEGAALSAKEIDSEVANLGLGHVIEFPPPPEL